LSTMWSIALSLNMSFPSVNRSAACSQVRRVSRMLARSSVAARAHAETTVGVPSVNVKAPKLFGARASPYEGPLAPGEHRGLRSGAATKRSNGRRNERLILQPAERGGRNEKEVWRDIRGRTLPAHASSLRLVDEASPQKAPGKWAESCAEPR